MANRLHIEGDQEQPCSHETIAGSTEKDEEKPEGHVDEVDGERERVEDRVDPP
jgi:hypothetical protein